MTLKVMELPFNFGFNKETSRLPGGSPSVSPLLLSKAKSTGGRERERERKGEMEEDKNNYFVGETIWHTPNTSEHKVYKKHVFMISFVLPRGTGACYVVNGIHSDSLCSRRCFS